MQLYNIAENYTQLMEMAENGANPDELVDALNDVQDAAEEKLNHILFVIRNMSASIDAIKAEENRLKERRVAIEKQQDSMKQYMIENMAKLDIKRVDNGVLKASYVKPKPMLNVLDDMEVPDNYKKIETKVSLDKRQLLADLKDGQEIEGVELSQSKASLLIK